MLRLIFCVLFTASTACAETVSDAFGILPAAALSEDRAAWAGLRTGTNNLVSGAGNAETLMLFIGAKSLVAGKEEGHAVSLALDEHGNLVTAGTVGFQLAGQASSASIHDGLADVTFQPRPIAGTFAGGARMGSLQSPRALFRVVADLSTVQPVPDVTDDLIAESFSTLTTQQLRDQYGNTVEDGVGTLLLLEHVDGTTTVMSPAVKEGRAETAFLSRDVSSGGLTQVTLGANAQSRLVGFEASALVDPVKMLLWPDQDLNATSVRIGPVGTTAGYLLNDGAPVSVTVTVDGQTMVADGWLKDGFFEAKLPLPPTTNAYQLVLSTPLGSVTQTRFLSEAPEILRGVQ